MSKMVITENMVKEFNRILTLVDESVIRLVMQYDGWGLPRNVDIVLVDDKFLTKDETGSRYCVYPNAKFYKKLEDFFASYGITGIKYNNTGNSFWKYEE